MWIRLIVLIRIDYPQQQRLSLSTVTWASLSVLINPVKVDYSHLDSRQHSLLSSILIFVASTGHPHHWQAYIWRSSLSMWILLIVSPNHSGQGGLFSSVVLIILISFNYCCQCWSPSWPALYLEVAVVNVDFNC